VRAGNKDYILLSKPYVMRQPKNRPLVKLQVKGAAEKRVLVTGGAGFIGSFVTERLANMGCCVTVLDNLSSGKPEYVAGLDRVSLVKGDVCDEETVQKVLKDNEAVVHLAALPFIPDSYHLPEEFFRVNSTGTVNVLWKAIQSENVERFVHVSSSEVYGSAIHTPMNEDHPTLPHSTYAVSKLAGDRAVFTMHKEHGFPAVIIRPFNSYGPNITQPYIIPEIVSQLQGTDGHVRLGNVDSSRDFTYVTDVAEGIALGLFKDEAVGETINLGSGRDVKIREIVSLVAGIMGKKAEIELDSSRVRPYDVDRLVCDNSKAQRLLGWKPRVPLEEGLRRTVEWILRTGITFKTPFKGWPRTYREARVLNVQE